MNFNNCLTASNMSMAHIAFAFPTLDIHTRMVESNENNPPFSVRFPRFFIFTKTI